MTPSAGTSPFEQFDGAHRRQRVRQHHGEESGFVHRGRRASGRVGDTSVDEQNAGPAPFQAERSARMLPASTISAVSIPRLPGCCFASAASCGEALRWVAILPAAAAPFLCEAEAQAARGAQDEHRRFLRHAAFLSASGRLLGCGGAWVTSSIQYRGNSLRPPSSLRPIYRRNFLERQRQIAMLVSIEATQQEAGKPGGWLSR